MRAKSQSNKDKYYILFIFFLYIFILRDWLEQIFPSFSYYDELFALLAVPIFIFELSKNQFRLTIKNKYNLWIALFLLMALISSLVNQYQDLIKIALPDLFLCAKFWLALYVGQHIFKGLDLKKYGRRISFHVKLITTVYFVLFWIDQIFKIFSASSQLGVTSTHLMYTHPTVLVACCVFLLMILFAVREYSSHFGLWMLILCFLMCTTLKGKAIGFTGVVIFLWYIIFHKKNKLKLKYFFIIIPLTIVLAWDKIYYYFFSSIQSDSARYQLLITSFQIANDYFPFGTGLGTFASYFSTVNYSPIYFLYGLSNVNGLRLNATNFASDSFWPMIIGQSGWIGFIAYVVAVIMLFIAIQKLYKINLSFYAAALIGLIYVLIASMAEAAFVHPVVIPLAAMIGFMLSQKDKEKEEGLMFNEKRVVVIYKQKCTVC